MVLSFLVRGLYYAKSWDMHVFALKFQVKTSFKGIRSKVSQQSISQLLSPALAITSVILLHGTTVT